jgi:hypothetical protein
VVTKAVICTSIDGSEEWPEGGTVAGADGADSLLRGRVPAPGNPALDPVHRQQTGTTGVTHTSRQILDNIN